MIWNDEVERRMLVWCISVKCQKFLHLIFLNRVETMVGSGAREKGSWKSLKIFIWGREYWFHTHEWMTNNIILIGRSLQEYDIIPAFRSSHRKCSVRKGVLRNFGPGCRPQACNFIKIETMAQVFSYEFCEISKNTFFTEHVWAIASEPCLFQIPSKSKIYKEQLKVFIIP